MSLKGPFLAGPVLAVLAMAAQLLCAPAPASALGIELLSAGDDFPEVILQAPGSRDDRAYLGLEEEEVLTLSRIGGEVVLVELLNVHCVHCQQQTRPYNALFNLIEEDPETRGRIRMLGVAVGNRAGEVRDFRQRYGVRFPVLADPDFALYRAIGGGSTPLSIYVRQAGAGRGGVVAGTHLGLNNGYSSVFRQLKEFASADPEELRRKGQDIQRVRQSIAPLYAEEDLQTQVRLAFIGTGGVIAQFAPVSLPSGRRLYTALMRREGKLESLFAEVVSRISVCDICHDVHFIYVFDADGQVAGFRPLLLTKAGNEDWGEADLAKMRRRVLGAYLAAPRRFDGQVDAVTSATITSAIIFDSLAQGEALLEELREQGLL